ncbi:MAG: alpha/beta fold hydrolase [Desulfopila sp.]
MATILFVHGAFQGGWVWRDTARVLRELGHDVHTPTLSGCGFLNHGMREGVDLNTLIQDVVNYLHFFGLQKTILVAHSFSGMIVSAVMSNAPHAIDQAVFVDAIIPEKGRSFAETAGEAFRHMLSSHRVNGWKVKPWPLQVFGVSEKEVGAERAHWFGNRLCTFPVQPFLSPFPGEFEPTAVPVSYISCTKTVSPFIRAMAKKAADFDWPVTEIETGHCPMITHHKALAEKICDVMQLQAESAA